jgi:glutathione S-transferase
MALRLHRCSNDWVTCEGHPCWRVQTALDAAGVEYEVVRHPAFPRTARTEYIALTGCKTLPALELEDGTIVHEESRELVRMIEAGELGVAAGAHHR